MFIERSATSSTELKPDSGTPLFDTHVVSTADFSSAVASVASRNLYNGRGRHNGHQDNTLSATEIERAYARVLDDLRLVPFANGHETTNAENFEKGTQLGNSMHDLDTIFHIIRAVYDGRDPAEIIPCLQKSRQRLVLPMGYEISHYSLAHDLFEAKNKYLGKLKRDFENEHIDVPLSDEFMGLMTSYIVHESTVRRVSIMGNQLARIWLDTDSEYPCLGDHDTYREVPVRVQFADLGIIANARLDGVWLGANDGVQVMDLKTGNSNLTKPLDLEIRLRQAQLMIALAILARNRFDQKVYIRSIDRVLDYFKGRDEGTEPGIVYRYFDKATGKMEYVPYIMDLDQARDFVIWFKSIATWANVNPDEFKLMKDSHK